MTRASDILESTEEEAAQSFADGLQARFDKLNISVDEIEVVVDDELDVVFLELEKGEESVTLAAINADEKQMLIIVSADDESLAIDLEPLNPSITAEGYVDFSDSSWLTKRVIDAIFNAARFLSESVVDSPEAHSKLVEAVAMTAGGRVSQLAIIHKVSKNDELLITLRVRAQKLGLDAIGDGDDASIVHIDPEFDEPVAGDSNYGLFKVKEYV